MTKMYVVNATNETDNSRRIVMLSLMFLLNRSVVKLMSLLESVCVYVV